MEGQNINLPVCLSVCVSITLSVNLRMGQTAQQIFTVDSLKDADLRKDVPFGGLQSPQNPHFGSLNRHFKPNMQKIQIHWKLVITRSWGSSDQSAL